MGQGPVLEPRFLLIGNGRLSRHLQRYFRSLQLQFAVWTRSSEQPLADVIPRFSHALLTISDDALEGFLQENPLEGLVRVHFSGSVSSTRAWGAHPLMTFTAAPYPLEEYGRIHFVIDEDAPGFADFLP